MPFTHLHVHTEYSLLDGSSKITELIEQVKKMGMDSIAITDHGVMYGVIDFYKEAKKQGIKPIIGCEVYVAHHSRWNKESKQESGYYHLVLLAENQVGYQNLMKLVSDGFTEGFYYKPRIDLELLANHSEGIIGLSACLAGQVSNAILKDDYEHAKEVALQYEAILGKGNFFLELQDHGYKEQKKVNIGLIKLSKEINIPLVATNDIHYTFAEDAKAHDILLCIQTNKKVDDQDRMRYPGGQFYAKSPEEMLEIFPEHLEALENTHKIAERCKVDFEFGNIKLPKYDVPKGYDAREYLRYLCNHGIKERYVDVSTELLERMEFELSVIEEMGYVDYFLIVWDFIKYAKDNDIIVGPGRGSAAGSIVSYVLRITDIDPIKYQLLFERFLNPERISLPDIDIDFCYERRQEIIDYVVAKYGEDKVAQIITFGTMSARAVIRDVGRALNLPYPIVDKVAKMIPQELKITIDKALKVNSELGTLYKEDEQIKYLIDMSRRLEGLPRHSSTHAAGVVICEKPVYEYVPLNASDGAITTQFTMTTLEELGLLKMDFLGLRTLTVIQNAVKQIKVSKNIDINMDTIPYDDSATFELISSGKTEGVFQLESAGMKSFMKDLKPENIEDIIAGVSLYRPGPMDFIPQYIAGKRNPGAIKYACEELIPILEPTYGCIVYQEQVMQIVRDLAGYTLGRSDLVRRAMSKKKEDVMNEERNNFIYGNDVDGVPGCAKKGISEAAATEIFNTMTDFAKYAFNKSHAAAYAIVAYQTAWLKTHYPIEFMAALLTSVMDNPSKVSEYIATLKSMEITLLPPDINEGYWYFSVSKDQMRFSLAAVKNVGKNAIKVIVDERERNGRFESFTQVCERLGTSNLNKRLLESLIKAGAFDSLGGNRKQYMQGYKPILDAITHGQKTVFDGQIDLFSFSEDVVKESFLDDLLPQVEEYHEEQLLTFEKEVLGIYVSGHPLQSYGETWERLISHKSFDFSYEDDQGISMHRLYEGQNVIIGGLISEKTIKTVRNNKTMAFLMVEDLYGVVEAIVFPNLYEQYKSILLEDEKIFIKGRVSIQEEQNAKIICSQISRFDDIIEKKLFIRFNDEEDYEEKRAALEFSMEQLFGEHRVVLYLQKENMKRELKNYRIRLTKESLAVFETIAGEENVKVKERVLKF
ncbi:MAG: DNA polymerase III subunit alpha [Firmicutes bacterium HGW-Firmicutes-1]|nr:MAG: DNA polymerase III subunit alpha [Firmicutes bacterium HGW-Firmicutes-1]